MDYIFVFLVLLPASLFDLSDYRIPNWFLVSGLLISLIRRLELQGLNSVWPWLAGMVFPLFIGFFLFRWRMFGASDGKLMAVVGSFVGIPGVFFVLFYSLIIGAVFSILKVIRCRCIHERWLRLRSYVKQVLLSGRMQPYYNRKKEGDTGVIPFGVAIGFGTLFSMMGGQ
ncbi:MAG: prepilin peptidase [Eubacterium sp.]|nr:prepilin peptidase [Eubacterium sp.]